MQVDHSAALPKRHEIISMVTMRHGFMPATRPAYFVIIVSITRDSLELRCAFIWEIVIHRQLAVVPVVIMLVMKMSFVDIVFVITMLYDRVATILIMLFLMIPVYFVNLMRAVVFIHFTSPLSVR
jgi:hypothetical protein